MLNDVTGGAVGSGPVATSLLDNPFGDGISFFQNLASGSCRSAAATAFGTSTAYVASKYGPAAAAKAASFIPDLSLSKFGVNATLSFGAPLSAGAQAAGSALGDFGKFLKLPWDLTATGFAVIACVANP